VYIRGFSSLYNRQDPADPAAAADPADPDPAAAADPAADPGNFTYIGRKSYQRAGKPIE